jgi:hypothetical protein
MADYQVFEGKDLRVPFKIVTASGKSGKVDGAVEVSSDDLDVASVAIDGDFIVITTANVGDALITLSADADLGEGKKYIETSFTVEVLSETVSGE